MLACVEQKHVTCTLGQPPERPFNAFFFQPRLTSSPLLTKPLANSSFSSVGNRGKVVEKSVKIFFPELSSDWILKIYQEKEEEKKRLREEERREPPWRCVLSPCYAHEKQVQKY